MKVGSAPNALIRLRHGLLGYFAVIGYCTVDTHFHRTSVLASCFKSSGECCLRLAAWITKGVTHHAIT
jgi:hypothetical protein